MDEQYQPQQPTTPEPEFQPSPPQGETLRSQPDKKLSIYVLVGLIVAGVAFEFYIWEKGGLLPALPSSTVSPTPTATPDPTADWKTYTNTQYGFEFKYPLSGYYKEYFFDSTGVEVRVDDTPLFFVTYYSNFESATYDARLGGGSPKNLFEWASYYLENARRTVFMGMEAVEGTNSGDGLDPNDYYITIFFEKNNRYYDISYRIDIKKEVSDQILSTFKFIEPTACIQVITPARNIQTGEVRDFPTPCDVPEGWELVK